MRRVLRAAVVMACVAGCDRAEDRALGGAGGTTGAEPEGAAGGGPVVDLPLGRLRTTRHLLTENSCDQDPRVGSDRRCAMGCEDAEISAGEGEDFLLEFPSLGFVGDCVRLEEPDSFTCRGPSKLTVTSTQLVGRVREGQVVDVVWSVAASRSDGLGCVLAGEARLAPLDG